MLGCAFTRQLDSSRSRRQNCEWDDSSLAGTPLLSTLAAYTSLVLGCVHEHEGSVQARWCERCVETDMCLFSQPKSDLYWLSQDDLPRMTKLGCSSVYLG